MQNTADAKIVWYLVLNVAIATQRNDGRDSSGQFLEAQAISSSLDGRTVAACGLAWSDSFNHPVVCCSPSLPYYSHLPISLCCVCI